MLFIYSNKIFAQTKDTTKTALVNTQPQLNTIIGSIIDSTQKQFFVTQDATSLLEATSNAFVRNYGLSNLSTLSMRGSSVAQTNVLWNNIPIQNTMLGLTDLSTVPNFFFDEMMVYPSGFNQKGKSQSMAGRLELNNENKFSEKLIWRSKFLAGYESFENSMLGAQVGMTAKEWNASINYYNRQGKNRYEFYNTYSEKLDTIAHAFARQEQLMADLGFRPNAHHTFNLHYWRINNYREIPPLAFEKNIDRAEENKVNRFGLGHQFSKDKFTWQTSLGLTIDSFRYKDRFATLNSIAKVTNIPLQSSTTYFLNTKSDIGISYNQQLSFYRQKNIAESLEQYGAQVFYNNSNIWKRMQLNLFLQKQFTSIDENPLTYGARLSKKIGQQQLLYASYNTNYRIPTLNELYYFPGGNENLKPEKSKNVEISGRAFFAKKNIEIENHLAVYSRWVDDWILWTGSAIFFPDNIAEVWSRGVENNFSVSYKNNDWTLRNDVLVAYNRATSQQSYFVNDQSVGRQIPYVPRNTWRTNFYAKYKKIAVQINYTYTGYRFLTRDETEFVTPYSLLNFFAGYNFLVKNQQIILQAKVNNILDEAYESVRGRIMPSRNFAISIIVEGVY